MSETLKTDIYNKIDKATSDEIKNKAEFLEEGKNRIKNNISTYFKSAGNQVTEQFISNIYMENYSYLKDVWQINSRDELKSKFDKLTTEQELLNKVDEIADSILQKKLGELKQKTENLANAIKNAVKPQHLEDDRFSNSEWQEVFDALPKDLLEEFDIRNKTDLKDFLGIEQNSEDYMHATLVSDSGGYYDSGEQERISNDSALFNIDKVDYQWIADNIKMPDLLNQLQTLFVDVIYGSNQYEKIVVNFMGMVTRNLNFQGKPINKENVVSEMKRILQERQKYKDVLLFKQRNVIIAANGEKYHNGDGRFGTQGLVNEISQEGGNVNVLKPEEKNLESLKKTKQDILNSVANTEPPFTFVFSGHGKEDALYLADENEFKDGDKAEIEKNCKITTDELFQVYKTRQAKFGEKLNSPQIKDIFVNSSCFSGNFIRNFYLKCDSEKISKPIFIGSSEYGQHSYSNPSSEYGSDFFDKIFYKAGNNNITLGHVIDADSIVKTNPSFYIPDENNTTMQIAGNRNNNRNENIA